MFKKYTVANWMENEGVLYTKEANKYIVGQNLTNEQAKEIIRMIAQGMGIEYDNPDKLECVRRLGNPYRQVAFKYTGLILEKAKRKSNWSRALWDALDEADKLACNDISNGCVVHVVNQN